MDQRTIELIHRDIDGLASPEEHRQLALLLQASEEARDEHARMRALCALLDGATSADPPPGLRDAILARIPVRASAKRPAAGHGPARMITGGSARKNWLGVAAAIAATVAGVALVLFRAPDFQQIDASSLAGTIGQPVQGAASLRLEGDLLSGDIVLQRHIHGFTIDFALETTRTIAIVAGAPEGSLALQGFLPHNGEPAGLSAEAGQIRVLHSGKQHYSLVVTPGVSGASTIDLRFYDGENLIREAALYLPAGRGSERD